MREPFPDPAEVERELLGWFDRHQRRLPWRQNPTPYRVWVAEIMLQQTRVSVVVPYYRRFLRAFPTLRRLARAQEEQVLRWWSGLGYYQRARFLHRAARQIVREHRGRFPRTLQAALALPGIGPYTARAILSIGFRQPFAVVDGNVARVLIRLCRLPRVDGANPRALQPLADRFVSSHRPGDFNQAFMELGSTVCLPRNPNCPACPLARLCRARRAGVERFILRPRSPRPRPRLRLTALVLRHRGRVLVVREPRGPFSGLWSFPSLSPGKLRPRVRGWRIQSLRAVGHLLHQTTMRDLELRVLTGQLDARRQPRLVPRQRWVRLPQIAHLGAGAATRKIAALVAGRTLTRERQKSPNSLPARRPPRG